jgi:tRNA(fMet)-specific endonuclease VapC
MNLLFDTNIHVHITRDTKRNLYEIVNPKKLQVFISIATLGEIRSIAYQNKWGEKRLNILSSILDNVTFVEINESILETYIQIDSFSQRRNPNFKSYSFDTPRNMGKNDL